MSSNHVYVAEAGSLCHTTEKSPSCLGDPKLEAKAVSSRLCHAQREALSFVFDPDEESAPSSNIDVGPKEEANSPAQSLAPEEEIGCDNNLRVANVGARRMTVTRNDFNKPPDARLLENCEIVVCFPQ